ncbi:MAG: fibronectin type III domain-containing protein [Deltaproteobacteria bacterium]|nr:fibronectin type III domain-containing protein [Deltaproteobacteria bacterium]
MVAGGDSLKVAARLVTDSAEAFDGAGQPDVCSGLEGTEKRICDDFKTLDSWWWPSEKEWSKAAFDLVKPETFKHISSNYTRFAHNVEQLRIATFNAWDGDFTIAGNTVLQIMHMKYDGCMRAGDCEDPTAVKEKTLAVPAAPGNLEAKSVDDKSIELTWDGAAAGDNVLSYKIFRDNKEIASIGATTDLYTVYTDSDLKPGTIYFYTVSAVNAAGTESAKSNSVQVTTPSAPVAKVAAKPRAAAKPLPRLAAPAPAPAAAAAVEAAPAPAEPSAPPKKKRELPIIFE